MGQNTTVQQSAFLNGLVDRVVLVSFTDGRQLIGTLLGHDTYTLRLQVTLKHGETEMLVYKHAVKYIATASG